MRSPIRIVFEQRSETPKHLSVLVPLLSVVAALVAFDLMRRSNDVTGLGALSSYAPSEKKKMSQFTAFNQFPYTLEQEVVKKMAPIVQGGSSMNKASYSPILEDLHDASPIN